LRGAGSVNRVCEAAIAEPKSGNFRTITRARARDRKPVIKSWISHAISEKRFFCMGGYGSGRSGGPPQLRIVSPQPSVLLNSRQIHAAKVAPRSLTDDHNISCILARYRMGMADSALSRHAVSLEIVQPL
jgi:hypothetical protein